MADPLTLVVPADPKYRVLGPEVASKFAELVGGSAADGEMLASTVSAALSEMAAVAAEGDHIDVTLQTTSQGVEITLRCGTRSSVVTQPLPARKQ